MAKLFPSLAFLTVALASGAAHAEGEAVAVAPATPAAPHFEIGARSGYYSPPVHGGTTPFGLGLGARAGYSFGTFYVGPTALFFFGGSDIDTTNHGALYGGEIGASFYVPAWGNAYLTFRPHVGLGGVTVFHTEPSTTAGSTATTSRRDRLGDNSLATATGTDVITAASVSSGGGASSIFGNGTTTSVSSFYVEPGVSAMLSSGTPSGGTPYVGIDASTLVMPSVAYGGSTPSTWLSFSLGASLGLMF